MGKFFLRFFLVFIFCFFIITQIFSLPPQKILHPGDWAYGALGILSREQGRVFFGDSRITVAQMETFLTEIDFDSLSESGRTIFYELKDYLESDFPLAFKSDALSGGLNLILQPELYFKTNESSPWQYNYHERNALIQIPLGFSLGSFITAEMDLYFGQNEYAATLHDNYSNIPIEPVRQTDIHFPKRGYVSTGLPVGEASGVNLAIGIGDNFFGSTETGSIIISDYLERTVYAQMTIYSPALKYMAQVLQYEPNKYHYMHYLQVRPHKRVSLSLAEGVMVNAPLELRFLNPFTIFHSYESYKTYSDYNKDLGITSNEVSSIDELWDKNPDGTDIYDRTIDPNNHSRIGSYFGVKLELQPINNFRLYGLFVMDQFNLPMKKDNWLDTLYPDAAGFQAGLEFSLPSSNGYWEFGLEGVYTYPYLYVMWDKGWSFYKEAPEMDYLTLRYWTGTPFGPDSIAVTFWAGLRGFKGIRSLPGFNSTSQWYAGFAFEFAARGERSDLSIFDKDNNINDTYRPSHRVYDVTVPPTGIPVYSYTTSFRFEYQPRKWLSIALMPGFRVEQNSHHEEGRTEQSFELALSLIYRPINQYLAKF